MGLQKLLSEGNNSTLSFVWSALLYCLLSVFPSFNSKSTHIILPLEFDWIILKSSFTKLNINCCRICNIIFIVLLTAGFTVVRDGEGNDAPVLFLHHSVTILTVFIPVCLLENRKTFSFFKFWIVSVSGHVQSVPAPLGSHPLGTTEMEWFKCSFLCLCSECAHVYMRACMHLSIRHLCIWREIC